MAFGILELAEDHPLHDLLGPEDARAAEALSLVERCADVRDADVERDVTLVALGAGRDAAADAAEIAGAGLASRATTP